MEDQDTRWDDERFDMFSEETQFKTLFKIYGLAFAFVIFIVMPWAIGGCMMAKWMFQLIF